MTVNQLNQIKRNACGSIDTGHYANLARQQRSGFAVGLVLKLCKSIATGFHRQEPAGPLNLAPAFYHGRPSKKVENSRRAGSTAGKAIAA